MIKTKQNSKTEKSCKNIDKIINASLERTNINALRGWLYFKEIRIKVNTGEFKVPDVSKHQRSAETLPKQNSLLMSPIEFY